MDKSCQVDYICDCCGHNCTLVNTKSPINMDDGVAENQNNRYAKIDKPNTDRAGKRGSSKVSANDAAENVVYGECDCSRKANQCLPSGRILTRNIRDTRKRSQRDCRKLRNTMGQDMSDDMLNVLITRPEIAEKPRDNIVFEGDMDLKTTFETSYENLAKMRLDYWKQRQQIASIEDEAQQEQGVSVEELIERDQSEASNGSDEPEVEQEQTPDQLTLANENLIDDAIPTESNLSQMVDTKDEGSEELCLSPRELNYNQPYIDPDLSSIIVYDANMNRLEKVGVRKRSKYRPSTSLRTGARGLFGDQVEEVAVVNKTNASSGNDSKPDVNDSTLAKNKIVGQRELSLNARNLNNSSQPNHLTYTAHNLPIDSKRKLYDNINMRDHIKEQNIVARHNSIITSAPQPTLRSAEKFDREYLDGLNLAQQEEASAVEELQRITSLPENGVLDETNQLTAERKDAQTASSVISDRESRQSKLERTCQNQSFYLFENEYPEQKQIEGEIRCQSRDTTQIYHRPTSYNNLFRESPDFILTTKGSSEDGLKSTLDHH